MQLTETSHEVLLYSMMITLTPWIYNLSVPVQVSCMSECYMGNYDQEV